MHSRVADYLATAPNVAVTVESAMLRHTHSAAVQYQTCARYMKDIYLKTYIHIIAVYVYCTMWRHCIECNAKPHALRYCFILDVRSIYEGNIP